jgi:hypothetical protein
LALCGEYAYQIVPHDVESGLKRKVSNPSLAMLATGADLGVKAAEFGRKVSPEETDDKE